MLVQQRRQRASVKQQCIRAPWHEPLCTGRQADPPRGGDWADDTRCSAIVSTLTHKLAIHSAPKTRWLSTGQPQMSKEP